MGVCKSKCMQNTQYIPENINPSTIKKFIPPITSGRVIKCYDGDTITVASYLPYNKSNLYKFSVRIRKNIPQEAGLGGGSMNQEDARLVDSILSDLNSGKPAPQPQQQMPQQQIPQQQMLLGGRSIISVEMN